MDAATIFYRIGEFHPTFFPAKSSSSWLRRFAHLAERQLSNNRVVSFLPFFLHSFSPSLLLAASICPIQFTVGFSRGQPRPQPSAAVQRRLRPSKGTATAIRTSGGPEAHFAKILCDVAHSIILLCATSHKIFAKWASDLEYFTPCIF